MQLPEVPPLGVRMRTLGFVVALICAFTPRLAQAQFMGPYACGHDFHFERLRVPRLGTLVRSTDLNHDGVTDLYDLRDFRVYYLHHPRTPETDLNGDGATDLRDFALLQAVCTGNSKGVLG